MYNYAEFGDQIEKARINLFGNNLNPEVRPGWGPLPALNFDPTRIIRCEVNDNGESIPTENVVVMTEEK
jgi:hypothetical protein